MSLAKKESLKGRMVGVTIVVLFVLGLVVIYVLPNESPDTVSAREPVIEHVGDVHEAEDPTGTLKLILTQPSNELVSGTLFVVRTTPPYDQEKIQIARGALKREALRDLVGGMYRLSTTYCAEHHCEQARLECLDLSSMTTRPCTLEATSPSDITIFPSMTTEAHLVVTQSENESCGMSETHCGPTAACRNYEGTGKACHPQCGPGFYPCRNGYACVPADGVDICIPQP